MLIINLLTRSVETVCVCLAKIWDSEILIAVFWDFDSRLLVQHAGFHRSVRGNIAGLGNRKLRNFSRC